MTKARNKAFLAGLMAVFLFAAGAQAEDLVTTQVTNVYFEQIKTAMGNRDYKALQKILDLGSTAVDEVVRSLLESVQKTMANDPKFAQKNITLAGKNATGITPPSVPLICSDMRRIADTFPKEQIGTPFYDAVVTAAQAFAHAPVVVAAGRPNLCEQAWLDLVGLDGDPLLAQTHGHRDPPFIPPVPPPTPGSPD